MTGVRLAVALVNLTEPWSIAELDSALKENWVGQVEVTQPVCDGLHQLAGGLMLVFEAPTTSTRCDAINRLLIGRAAPFLTMHDDLPPHLHFAATEDALVERVAAFMAGSLAIFTVESGGHRLGACERRTCRNVYADTSLNGRRTYCSARCANSDAVERHRERKRAQMSA